LVRVAACGLLGFGLHQLVNFESKVLCTLFLAGIYAAMIARFGSRKWEVNMTKSKKVASGSALACSIVLCCGFYGTAQSARYLSKGELGLSRARGFQALGLPAPKDELELVEEDFRKALEYDPECMRAYWYWGRARIMHRFYGEDVSAVVGSSVDLYDEAIKRSPQMWRLWAERGEVLAIDPARVEEARVSLRHALELAPSNASSWIYYKRFLEKQNEEEERLEVLERIKWIDGSLNYHRE
jgi:hypothetical protein